MKNRLKHAEEIHTKAYRAHWGILAAEDAVHAIIVMLHEEGRYKDVREEVSPYLAKFIELREALAQAMELNSKVRQEFINVTGCDNTCSSSSSDLKLKKPEASRRNNPKKPV